MNFKILTSFIYVVSLSYIPTSFAADGKEGDRCKQAAQEMAATCDELMNAVKNNGLARGAIGIQAAQRDINRNSGIQGTMARGQAGDISSALAQCKELQNQCFKRCKDEESKLNSAVGSQEVPSYFIQNADGSKSPNGREGPQKAALKEGGEQICGVEMNAKMQQLGIEGQSMADTAAGAQRTNDASRNDSKGGGMSPMMAGLLGAALGGAAGYMMGKKKGEKDKDKDKDKDDGDVVADDGTVDCTKSGAEAYSDCNSYFESKCAADLSAEGCSGFTARYCSAAPSGSSDTSTTTDTSSDTDNVTIASASDKGITGEGLSTQFCFTAQATSFCETAGRESCPSCLQLEANKAEACQSNPALCLMQNSPTEIEAAKNSCPSDPLFSNPDYVAGGGATVENADTLEDPILPSQYASSSSSSDIGGGSAVSGSSPSDTAGAGNDSTSSGASDVADGSASSSGSSGSGVIGSSPSDVAAGGSLPDPVLPTGGLTFASATGSRSPASVGQKMGPSLFSMSSAMIESRCKKAQLAHCSK